MRIALWILALAGVLTQPTLAQAPVPEPTAAVTAVAPVGAAQLTAGDVDAWLDGIMPYAIKTGDIAGAVVVVVKDGQILTQRGYGLSDVKAGKPVDPQRTLFRPGSVSKLLTWTAVMQEVQAGRIDLDKDINSYLDFKIPEKFGKPITMRNLMTHTAGFEETVKYLIVDDAKHMRPLGEVLKRWVPMRVNAPGTVASYSNYGASLAGYIVERTSGISFDRYVQDNILNRLGMSNSSFYQPLTPQLLAGMSQGYMVGSGDPQRFELIPFYPAGSLSATGEDMGRFMIAHLAQGGPLLDPKTAALTYAPAHTPIAGMQSMALGFYHEDRNGLRIVGHGGDTNWFHSDLHLFLDKGVGLFVSYNSGGKEGAAHVAREQLFKTFADRYFPQAPEALPTLASAKAHGSAMVGHYLNSRGSVSNWLSMIGLISQLEVTQNEDDTISVSALAAPGGALRRWREVRPWQWMEVGGTDMIGALEKDGKVTAFAPGDWAPIFLFQRVSGTASAGFTIPAGLAALGILLITALAWPIVALVRRRYGYRPALAGRPLQLRRASSATAWIVLLVVAGWAGIIAAFTADVAAFDGRMDGWIRLIQLLTLLGVVGTALSIWNAFTVWRTKDAKWLIKVWSMLTAVAAFFVVWQLLNYNTVTFALNY